MKKEAIQLLTDKIKDIHSLHVGNRVIITQTSTKKNSTRRDIYIAVCEKILKDVIFFTTQTGETIQIGLVKIDNKIYYNPGPNWKTQIFRATDNNMDKAMYELKAQEINRYIYKIANPQFSNSLFLFNKAIRNSDVNTLHSILKQICNEVENIPNKKGK